MKANSLEELVTKSNIAGELRNYTDWHTRLVKFAKLVSEWQKEQDLAEMAQSKSPLSVTYANRCFKNGKQAMKQQMLKDAVEAKVVGFDILNRTILLTNIHTDLNMDDKVRIIVVKAEEK